MAALRSVSSARSRPRERGPRGINIWENTWAGQTEDLVSQFLDTGRDATMEEWWNRNLHLRRGGYDRILVPAAFSPTLAELDARAVTGEVFWQEIVWLPFGEPRRYLDAVAEQLMPALEQLGLVLVGAFRVAMRPRQVLTIIGAPEWSRSARCWTDHAASLGCSHGTSTAPRPWPTPRR